MLAGLEALAALPQPPKLVLIHDAARPFVAEGLLVRLVAALEDSAAVLAAVPVADTLKRANAEGLVIGQLDRSGLWAAQTPQGFHFDLILKAHRRAADAGRDDFTDDAAVAEWVGSPVAVVMGDPANRQDHHRRGPRSRRPEGAHGRPSRDRGYPGRHGLRRARL